MRIAFVSSSLPRRCGIATFTSDLMAATRTADPDLSTVVAAIDEPNVVRPYEREVRWRIRQGDPSSYRAAAAAINDSKVDVVNVQHEFGLYGTWHMAGTESVYEDHLRPFLEELRKPVVTTLHSVPPEPSPSMREAVLSIVELSQQVVVMAATAVDLLATDYDVQEPPIVIPHGMPAIEPHGRIRIKAKLGLQDRTIISTFGLVDPRKGLEYMVEAMPDVVARHPNALYLIAGQTHPNLLRSQGEQYRNSLIDTVERLGLRDHVSFIDQYLAQRDIIDLLLASDVYVTPYPDPRQITSGTLAYAREMTWPKLGRRWVELMSRPAAADTTRPRPREAKTGADRHAGSPPTTASIAAMVPTTKSVGTEILEDERFSPSMPPDMMPSLMTHGRP